MKSTNLLRKTDFTAHFFALLTLLLALIVISAQTQAQAQEAAKDPEGAQQFIHELSDNTVSVWTDPTLTESERGTKFRALLHDGFAVNFISKLVLGRHRRTASKEQLAEYSHLFPPYLVNSFARRLGDYGNEELVILGTAPAGKRDLFVRTKILRPGGEPIATDWRLRKFGDAFQIVDIKVEGISLAITQRDEFSAIVGKNGFEGLLRVLRKGAKVETASVAETETETEAETE